LGCSEAKCDSQATLNPKERWEGASTSLPRQWVHRRSTAVLGCCPLLQLAPGNDLSEASCPESDRKSEVDWSVTGVVSLQEGTVEPPRC
jgi:hypothetical protein